MKIKKKKKKKKIIQYFFFSFNIPNFINYIKFSMILIKKNFFQL